MARPRRLTELRSAIDTRVKLPEPPYVIALSGGADSAALAAIAAGTGVSASCVHVHHAQPASDELAAAAGKIASALGLEMTTVEVEPEDGPSPEAMAREARYAAFARSVPDDSSLLLGHTRDDQAETVLLNVIRGAGTRGLSGMPYHRPPNIYRPILAVTRSETRELASLLGLAFVDDPTNTDLSLARNRVRLDILPRLAELNPNIIEGLARLADHTRDDADYLDSLAAACGEVVVRDTESVVPLGALLVMHRQVRVRVLVRMVSGLRDGGLTRSEHERIEDVMMGRAGGAQLEGGLRVERSGPLLVVRLDG